MNQQISPYDLNLDQQEANHVSLSPLSFIERSAAIYPQRTAVVHGQRSYTWRQTYRRCLRLASCLHQRGIGVGDTVAVLAPNIPALYEAHFGIPMAGAVVNAINTRLDARTIAFQFDHARPKLLIADLEFAGVVRAALDLASHKPAVAEINDTPATGESFADLSYEALLSDGDPEFAWSLPVHEWQAISLNYTSGTTGNPKGVVYHHRGAYLNAIGNAMSWDMRQHPIYLWTLPMFHCNGWCFPWTIAAMAGTNVCLRKVEAKPVFDAIAAHRVSHFCGAPVVLNMIRNSGDKPKTGPSHVVNVATGGAPPPEAVIQSMEQLGFRVSHLYGLTETYGPAAFCAWHDEWDDKPLPERARIMARQGVNVFTMQGLMVADPESMQPVAMDGDSIGEIMLRGNTVMKGYLGDPDATATAFRGGWFHSGDLAVRHADGYVQIKDRSKDIIISGGENISTIEVEDVLFRHPEVLEAAVVARADENWGETPCAFVTLKEGADANAEDIIEHCRAHLAHFKAPRTVVFGVLPKTATGKVRKYILRERAAKL